HPLKGPFAPTAAEAELLLLQRQALAEEEAAKTKRELLAQIIPGGDSEAGEGSRGHSDLEEADEQQNRALRSHLHLTDRLLELQLCRLSYLEEGFNTRVAALKAEFEVERKAILEQGEWESSCLQDMALAREQDHSNTDHEAILNFQSARDEIKNQSWQEQQYSRIQLVARLEGLWDQIQKARRSYAEATEKKKIEFEELKRKCEKSSREIDTQAKKLQKLQVLAGIAATKSQIAAHLRQSEEHIQRVREEKEQVLHKLYKLRSEMTQAGAMAHSHLVTLICQCNGTLKALQQLVEKAQRILRLAEMCRRLETEEEKVVPFYRSSLAEWEQEDARRVLEETPTEPLAEIMQDYVGLERFWQRFNKVKLEEKALERVRVTLANRNQHLRELLQQYLQGAALSLKVVRDPHPLLTTKQGQPVLRDNRTWNTPRATPFLAPAEAPWQIRDLPGACHCLDMP
uniref:Coiled-coil domain containing 65 n=1 Tax=Malurus cyaneus samueli TaxID=2593467 RepID=A0A8C5TBT5_9PASS